MALDKITTGLIADDAITSDQLGVGAIAGSDLAADVIEVIPHIKLGTLQPAIAGKLLNGASHSGAYGTPQTQSGGDGFSYYYTDIKGSKPIKDPRIGSHFGSQRHKFKSLQILEQETATHGQSVFSVDGREWVRACGDKWVLMNNNAGSFLENSTSSMADDNHFIEIVSYFNDANLLFWPSHVNNDRFGVTLNGGTRQATDLAIGAASPLSGSGVSARFVDSSSVVNCTFHSGSTPTLGINTLRISNTNGSYLSTFGFELIAQDTTSTASKSKVQIPAQNVVSHGKKFTVAATAHHYNPFAFKTDGSTVWASGAHNGTAWPIGTGSSTNIDTATSLGLAAWVSTNYYKPYNGGRIVKWVASDGTIKTSVNMMPPNAQNIAGSAISAKANASIANNTYLPTFTGAIDHSQAEVAKTFHWREFGNGAANGGPVTASAGGNYKDVSMQVSTADVAYVMDDGLTSFSGDDVNVSGYDFAVGSATGTPSGDFFQITFIGTGLTISLPASNATEIGTQYTIAQNLPYGTHIYKQERSGSNAIHTLDGVVLATSAPNGAKYITFHQPKMPPTPEDAVIISDYMLMADHVVRTNDGIQYISKGVRGLTASRDVFYNGAGSFVGPTLDPLVPYGLRLHRDTESAVLSRITAFSTNAIKLTYNAAARYQKWWTNDITHNAGTEITTTKNGAANGSYYHPNTATTLGQNIYDQFGAGVSALQTAGYEIVSPIHTSSHYQSFETPFLYELVGGDRNMEQTNLVVTSDGNTWDEVIRKTDYLSNTSLVVKDGADSWSSNQFWTTQRGKSHNLNMMSKEWITGYDRWICLVGGHYQMGGELLHRKQTSAHHYLYHNGNIISKLHIISNDSGGNDHSANSFTTIFEAKRGDYLYITGERHGASWSTINIKRI